jgi:Cutinase.
MHVMLFQKLVLALSWELSWGIHPVHSQVVSPERCATGIHAILARGQGPGDHLNVMVSIQNLILQLIPGSSSVALPYKHGSEDHRVAAEDGALMMQQYVREYVASCPHSKIFLMGYSLVRAGNDPSFRFFRLPHSSQFKRSCASYVLGMATS